MIDKEQIKDLMRNCSKGQYELLEHFGTNDISFYSFNINYRRGRMGIRYEGALAAELIFLLEEDEKAFLLDGTICLWTTPELGEYYLNKYSFLNASVNDTYRGIRYKVYNQKGQCVYSWYELYSRQRKNKKLFTELYRKAV